MEHSKGSSETEVHSDTGLPNKDINISNPQLNPTCTGTGVTTTNKAQASRRKDITRIRAELNGIE